MADGPLPRVLAKADGAFELLSGLPGADLTTLMLAVMRERAARVSGPELLRRSRTDRFVASSDLPFDRLRAAETAALDALPPEFDKVTLSPLAPLGLHSVLGTVHQNKVVSTVRGSEAAADPTNGLALEAALRRQHSEDVVRLAASQRVVRAQRVDGPALFAHFTLLGLVIAGRDTGNLAFERRYAAEVIQAMAAAVRARLDAPLEVRLTVLDPRFTAVADAIRAAMPGQVTEDPDRESGRGYYTGLCFKLACRTEHERFELGDGGFVPWTQELLGNRKERLFIGGLGIDRLATLD
ncbi:hypothetical protein [Amycolatopsis sp. 195334CR]|uniref:hypothetical protein n=1 Tax=Amycolatopsis sp. 195334CR TaxID=2814588 RepID=UPI001A90AEB9|nr:hypothetical protein [Amycolatopsis sp. 195334CR]MBN6039223.1 hypothetical protein [Amycolatopsis sp. 195334CR]